MNGRGLRVQNVEYVAGRTLIVRGVSLDIAPGQCVGILGPNGAGKSTLLRLIAAVLPATAGVVMLEGKTLAQWSAHERARCLAFVGQQPRLTFPFTVREVVLMGRTPYLQRWRQESELDLRITAEALHRTDMAHLAERDVMTLSGGEMQRTALARALAQQPRFLLLDEPTANLDLHHQVAVLQLLKDLARSGVTVLAVLHDLNFAAALCTTVTLMRAGEIYATGTPEVVLTRENIRAVYRADVLPTRHPQTGALCFFTFCTDPVDSSPIVGKTNNHQHQEAAVPLTSKEDPYAA